MGLSGVQKRLVSSTFVPVALPGMLSRVKTNGTALLTSLGNRLAVRLPQGRTGRHTIQKLLGVGK